MPFYKYAIYHRADYYIHRGKTYQNDALLLGSLSLKDGVLK